MWLDLWDFIHLIFENKYAYLPALNIELLIIFPSTEFFHTGKLALSLGVGIGQFDR